MEVLVLHILKLNIIAAVIILLVKLLAVPLKGRVSARWKYFIWLFVAVSLLIPVRVPGSISLVDLQLKKSSPDRIAVQEKDISATVPENGQYISQQETMYPEKKMYRIRIFPDRRSIPYMKLVNGWKGQQESLQQSGLSWRC